VDDVLVQAAVATEHFQFYGCRVEVSSREPKLVEEVRRDFLYFRQDAAHYFRQDGAQPRLRIEMRMAPPPYSELPAVPAAFFTPRNVCFRHGHTMYIDYFGRALAIFDRLEGRCLVYGTDHDLVHEAVYLFILSTVGQYLDRAGLHRVHALGVSYRDRAILLLLPSGGGKSTMALELLQQPGFRLLGEDTPLVDRRGRVLPFPLRIGVRPESHTGVPARHLRTMRRMEFDPKTLIDISYFEDRLGEYGRAVVPGLILVGERNLGEETEIVPLSRAGALAALVKYSVVGLGVYQGLEFLLERGLGDLAGKGGVAASRLYSSCRLLARAGAYRFVLGRNIQKNTRCLLDFLRRADG
jgi:hypothetical protein